jgi:hypothetical protein
VPGSIAACLDNVLEPRLPFSISIPPDPMRLRLVAVSSLKKSILLRLKQVPLEHRHARRGIGIHFKAVRSMSALSARNGTDVGISYKQRKFHLSGMRRYGRSLKWGMGYVPAKALRSCHDASALLRPAAAMTRQSAFRGVRRQGATVLVRDSRRLNPLPAEVKNSVQEL